MLYEFFQGIQMKTKGLLSSLSTPIGGLRLSSNELFPDLDEFFGFERFEMTGQVSICYFEVFFQGIVIYPFVHLQDGHHTEFNPAFKYLIQTFNGILHGSGSVIFAIEGNAIEDVEYSKTKAPDP